MKKEFTPEEEALIEEVYQEHVKRQTQQETFEDIQSAVYAVWELCEFDNKIPEIVVCESPIDCKKQADANGDTDCVAFWSFWYVGYNAMYDFANRIGLELGAERLELFSNWVRCCPMILFNDDRVYVSKKLKAIHFNDNRQLHNEEGMSCEFPDGWGTWTINGVNVDEQIVMRPETQTVKQIREEQNEEVKRIRIERYGWDKYLTEIGAKLVHENRNDIEGTKEFLFEATEDDMKALLCVCPSTGKEFVLEVPPATKTCQEAQKWLSSGKSTRVIGAS